LRPLLDYALRAAGPRGKVTIVDTPVEGCNLEEVVDGLGVRALLDWYAARGTRIDFIDLRHFRVVPHMALDNVVRGYGTRDFPVYEHTVSPEATEMPVEPRLIAELGAVLATNGLEARA